jgi:hypothetical protein
MSYLNKEVNRTDPSPLVRVPCFWFNRHQCLYSRLLNHSYQYLSVGNLVLFASASHFHHRYRKAKIDCLRFVMCPLLAQLEIGFFSSFSAAAVYSTNEANKAGLKQSIIFRFLCFHPSLIFVGKVRSVRGTTRLVLSISQKLKIERRRRRWVSLNQKICISMTNSIISFYLRNLLVRGEGGNKPMLLQPNLMFWMWLIPFIHCGALLGDLWVGSCLTWKYWIRL